MTKIQNPKQLLKKYEIRPLRKLGQNFLINKTVLKKIIDTASLSLKDIILEIGPGLGVLTQELAKRTKKVIAVEKDRTLSRLFEDILKTEGIDNVKVINEDALTYDLQPASYKLIANLPYYITSPVIRKFLETKNKPELMILMVQKEVAQRICAKPGKMSILAVSVQFYAVPKIISYISKKSFWPQPKVDSAILRITPQKVTNLTTDDHEDFFKLVKTGFSSKRKMLKNNLKIDESILKELGLNPKVRAEDLSIQDWLKVYEKIHQK